MRRRKLLDGRRVPEGEVVTIPLQTRCPSKWLLIDLECVQGWRWDAEAGTLFEFQGLREEDVAALELFARRLREE